MMMRIFAVLVLMGLVACGDDDGGLDAGGLPDAAFDSGIAGDTGVTPDAGTDDTGVPSDAGTMDAGPMGALCPSTDPCNVVTGAGCDEGSCYLGQPAGGGTATGMCVAEVGAIALGEACDTINGCAAGLSCIGGACRAPCCGDSDADCPAGGLCNGNTEVEAIGYCLFSDGCDMLAQTGCDEGEGCYPLGMEGGTLCSTAGAAADGAACERSNDCTGGSICLDDMTCHALCDPAGENTCEGEMGCAGLTAFDNVGVCVAPSA